MQHYISNNNLTEMIYAKFQASYYGGEGGAGGSFDEISNGVLLMLSGVVAMFWSVEQMHT